MARRGRGRNRERKPATIATDPSTFQLTIDFTPEQAMATLFEAGELSQRISNLKAEALAANMERRKLEGALSEILKQAAAKKRTEKVDVREQYDPETQTVRIISKADGSEVSWRHCTDAEKESGRVFTDEQAREALATVAAAVGETPVEEDEPAPEISQDPAVIASVQAAAHMTGAHA